MMPRVISGILVTTSFCTGRTGSLRVKEEKHPTQKRIVYLISEFDIRANNGPVETAATPLTK
jgi:hypothetical protein